MSTLHARLLARIDSAACHECGAWGADALRAVVERHKPRRCRDGNCWQQSGHVLCAACGGGRTYEQCPDTVAIARALGVETGETP